MSQLYESLAIRRPSAVHGSAVAASVRWYSAAVGLLIVLALLAIAALAVRDSQSGQLGPGGAAPGAQAQPASLGSQAASLPFAQTPSTALPAGAKRRAADAYAKLPLAFTPNAGQTNQSVRYYAQGAGFSFYFTDRKAVLTLQKGDRGQALQMRFLGANPNAKLKAADRASGKVNYLTDSARHTNLPTYGRLIYRNLWPGIDMVFRGQGGKLNYEFRLHPGAKVSDIRLAYAGAKGVSLGAGGALLLHTPLGTLRDAAPASYQRIDGRRVAVDSRYALAGNSYGFAVGRHDRGQPLVIDPSLAYSSYLGGSQDDTGLGIAVDSAGAAYVTGRTSSTDFPTTAGAFDTSYNGGGDAFVTKLNPAGSSLAYSTYLGGSSDDEGAGIAVDSAGSAYVTGFTESADFPTTAGAFDTSYNGGGDAFVTKLNPAGSSLTYSSYLGGSGFDSGGSGIAVDSSGAAYLTGNAGSIDFPTTAGAFDTSYNGGIEDAFVTKLNPAGSGLAYSSYLGGSDLDSGRGIAVDSAGAAYVTGETSSTDFPTTAGAFDTSFNGGGDLLGDDAFVTKLNPAGSGLAYSSYLGGSQDDPGVGIAVDSAGAAYVTGRTTSTDFPTTAGAFDTSFNGTGPFGDGDAFVIKLNPAGSGLAYSSYLGGSSDDFGSGIAVDSAGAAYVTGRTSSTDFPTTAGAFDTSFNGGDDAFVTKLNPAGSGLAYSSYLGGSFLGLRAEEGSGIAVDSAGAAYVTGGTSSTDFPTTAGAFDTSFNGASDAFVSKLPPVASTTHPTATTVSCSPASVSVGNPTSCTATVTDTASSGQTTPSGTLSFSSNSAGSFSSGASCTLSGSGASASCQLAYTPTAVGSGTHQISASYGGDATHATSSGNTNVTVTAATKHPTATTVSCSPGSVSVGNPTSCTATVTDTASAGQTTPSGTLSFSSNSGGSFSSGASCTLSGSGASASCQLAYTPTAVGSGTHQISASYGGDTTHATSSGNTDVTVTPTSVAPTSKDQCKKGGWRNYPQFKNQGQCVKFVNVNGHH